MADWVNSGSHQDLSDLLPGDPISALVPTSQHAGNQVWSSEHAHTAPGGKSGDLGNDLNQAVVVGPPKVDVADTLPPGTDGKPKATAGPYPMQTSRWGRTTKPTVNREK